MDNLTKAHIYSLHSLYYGGMLPQSRVPIARSRSFIGAYHVVEGEGDEEEGGEPVNQPDTDVKRQSEDPCGEEPGHDASNEFILCSSSSHCYITIDLQFLWRSCARYALLRTGL